MPSTPIGHSCENLVKTRLQLAQAGSQPLGSLLKGMSKEEGIGVFYRGIMAPIMAEAPKRAVKFTFNDYYKKIVSKPDGSMTAPRFFVAGALAGITEAFVNCPFEVLKVRMQSAEGKALYNGTYDAAVKIIRQEGVLAVYNGLEAQLWRNAAWNGTYFGLIGTLKRHMWEPQNERSELGRNFLAGFVAGTIATAANTPIDVVKSRMQNIQGAAPAYRWTLPGLRHIYRTEGLGALYSGFGMRMLRLGPGGGIMLVAFDLVSKYLRRMSEEGKFDPINSQFALLKAKVRRTTPVQEVEYDERGQ